MSKRLLRWFGDHRNEEVLGMVRDHLEMTQNAVQGLYNMVCTACEGPKDKDEFYKKISEYEMKADQLRRDMIVKLTERNVFPTEREDTWSWLEPLTGLRTGLGKRVVYSLLSPSRMPQMR